MSGNYRRYETNVLFNNNFKLTLLQLIMFFVTYVTVYIQYVLLWFERRHGDVCATGRWHRQ